MKRTSFKYFKNIIQCFVIFQFISCNNYETRYNKFPVHKELKGMSMDCDHFLSPSQILLQDNKIIISDKNSKNGRAILFFDLKEKKCLGFSGMIGKGPRELLTPWKLFAPDDDEKHFLVMDVLKNKLFKFHIDSAINEPKYLPSKINLPKDISLVFDAGMINDSLFGFIPTVSVSSKLQKGRIIVTNPSGNLVNVIARYPNKDLPSEANMAGFTSSYRGYFTVNPDKSKIAIVTRLSDRVDIYSAAGNLLHSTYGSHKGKIHAELDGFRIHPIRGKCIMGYTKVHSTNKYIYALFSGELYGTMGSEYADNLHVFTWDGKPVAAYHLNARLIDFVVDDPNNKIYGLSGFEDKPIVEFNLN